MTGELLSRLNGPCFGQLLRTGLGNPLQAPTTGLHVSLISIRDLLRRNLGRCGPGIGLVGLQGVDVVSDLIKEILGLGHSPPVVGLDHLAVFLPALDDPALALVDGVMAARRHSHVVAVRFVKGALGVLGRHSLSLIVLLLLLLGHDLLEHLILLGEVVLRLLLRRLLLCPR